MYHGYTLSNCTIDVAENRAIASEELVFLDNDRLSRRVAIQGELYVMGTCYIRNNRLYNPLQLIWYSFSKLFTHFQNISIFAIFQY